LAPLRLPHEPLSTMAIHPNLPGLVVSIRANGEDLPEYDEDGAEADERNPNACVKYIEAISGARFYIDYSFDSKTFPHINSNISVRRCEP